MECCEGVWTRTEKQCAGRRGGKRTERGGKEGGGGERGGERRGEGGRRHGGGMQAERENMTRISKRLYHTVRVKHTETQYLKIASIQRGRECNRPSGDGLDSVICPVSLSHICLIESSHLGHPVLWDEL